MSGISDPPELENSTPTSMRAGTSDDQDIIMSSDGEVAGMQPLPPHIAARFYRPTATRRKSSAASSRRNSLSSLHSNRSNLSCHGGPQSTHIAQHLRRASIIESRKARLADKAAHAEKVRLRAAMAKAAPRASAHSEERALAAKQAREKYLAQVAANCAEEVKRAKKVAEDMKERKAAEHLKLKGDMEERLAEAERRRIVYQQNIRRARTTSLPAVEEKKVPTPLWKPANDESAAKVIQKAWRNRKRKHIVRDFVDLGLTVERLQSTSFDDVGALLSQENVLTNTGRMLKLLGLQDGEGGGLGERTAVRTFLSTFLILAHPAQVISKDGEQEQDLITKAKGLLISFQHLLTTTPHHYNFSPLSAQLASLSEAFATFQTAFAAWKEKDSSVLVQTMLAQFVELDAIWQTVKGDKAGEVADDYHEGIQQNQTLLLVRLKRLAGPERAMKMIREAIRASRKARLKKKPTGDVMPRAVTIAPGASSDSVAIAAVEGDVGLHGRPTPSRTLQANELRKVTNPIPENRMVVHELAINREYRIDVTPQTDLRNRINRAVFNSIKSDLEIGLGDRWVVAMAENIRERLLRLLVPGKPLHVLISEALDPVVIENQLKIGSFSYEKFFSFMNSILPKLCAPVRDVQIRALAEDTSGDLIGRLEKLLHIIDLLSLDYANFLLQQSAPELIGRAPQYEQHCFEQSIKDSTLPKTFRWWSRARVKANIESARRAADAAPQPSSRVTPDKIYMQGLVDLAIAPPPLLDIDLPETLELDRERITRIRTDTIRTITISAILLTAKNLLKRDVRSQWTSEAQRLWELDFGDATATSTILSLLESSHAMPPSTKSQLAGTVERVLGDARSGQVNHPVMKVLLQKLKTHVFSRLAASSADERVRAASTASQVLASGGLPEFVGRVGAVVDELAKVAEVDRGSHGKWYDEVAGRVAEGVS
ncbi:T-complex 11 [Lasallia pustulata]|uniref:T-complex 11 n=1 Tax=Lasallia pustulata TaxID=136370 RepID=A0A1W5DCE3_9LECA|nr:T-complex 11 [Lasallia pustulata]